MKRLLNDPVMNDIGWTDYNKKVKQETDLQTNNRYTGLKQYLFFLLTPYLWWLNGPTYNGSTPNKKGQVKYFNSQSLSKLSSKYMTDQFRMALARRQMSLDFVSIIKLITRMAAVRKASVFAIYKTILPKVRIEPIKAVTSLLVNFKPTRPIISISRAHQVYKVLQDNREATAYLTAW